MAKGNIDPAMQAAPFLGESSHDPIEFTRRQTMIKYQRNKQRQDENQKNIAEGLDKLTLNLKDLYGEKGVDEILGDQARTKEAYVKLYKAGVNLSYPTDALAIKGMQAITKKQEESMKKADVLRANKDILELTNKALLEQKKILDKDKQPYDEEASYAKIVAAKKEVETKGILETQGIFDNLLVKKPEPGDLDAYVAKFAPYIPKVNVDPVSGRPDKTQLKEQNDYMEKRFATLPENELKVLQDLQKKVPAYEVAPLKDIFMDLYSPAAAGKLTLPRQNTGGDGIPFKFLGVSGKINPGELQPNDIVYGNRHFNGRYEFSFPTAKTFFIPPAGGEYATQDKWEPITEAGGPLEGNLLFYDPKTDALIFKTTQDARYPWTKNNTTVSIPRKNLANADDLPIMIDGKKKTLKDILPAEATSAKKKAYNPKTGKFEESSASNSESPKGKYDNL